MIITRNSPPIAVEPDLTKARIADLAALQDGWCLSLYLPLRRAGPEGRQARQAVLLLKDLDARARRELALRSASPREIETLLEPVENLLACPELPHLQGEGLALFSSRAGVACYLLPDPPEPLAEVDRAFRVDGLVPALIEEEPFLLLSLDLHAARLWEGNRLFLREIPLNGLHAHAPSTPVFEKHDAEEYCRRAERAVRERLRGCNLPLLLAGAYPLHALFRKVSAHPRLVDVPQGGSDRGAPLEALHGRAWASLKALRRAETRALLEEFRNGLSSWRTAAGIADVLPCSYDGSVSHLFLRKGYEEWGFFDPDTGKVTVDPARMAGSRNLASLACLNTLLDGGRVHVVDGAECAGSPDSPAATGVAALCRY
jgi:hypothetical protein